MAELVLNSEPGKGWYAVSVSNLDDLLIKVISTGYGYPHSYALRKNLCYNLQYLEYLNTTILDLKMSDVILTQTWKTFIITGCGILESLLQFLLVKHRIHSTTEWQLEKIFPGAEKNNEGNAKKWTVIFIQNLGHL